ncbi:MAG: hypothetical protein JEY91_07090 [Spirochaetaceae bacterium]|nr:hypothetical protein [Spirochaetaceae bacterium]
MKKVILTILVLLFISALLSCQSSSLIKESADIRDNAVNHAIWAMSAHNMQPWQVVLDKKNPLALDLYIDSSRLLPATDPYSRQIIISFGNFIAVLEDYANSKGYSCEYNLFPEESLLESSNGENYTSSVARIVFSENEELKEIFRIDSLSGATVKRHFDPVIFNQAEKNELTDLSEFDDIRIFILQEEDVISELKTILIDSFSIEMKLESTLMESFDLTRRSEKERREKAWGLSYLGAFPASTVGLVEFFDRTFPMKPEKWGEIGIKNYISEIETINSYLFINSKNNSRESQIHTGIALQRIWMELLKRGYAFLPASQPLQEYPEMNELYTDVHEKYALNGETIQMIGGIGKTDRKYKSGFRISAEKIIQNN